MTFVPFVVLPLNKINSNLLSCKHSTKHITVNYMLIYKLSAFLFEMYQIITCM